MHRLWDWIPTAVRPMACVSRVGMPSHFNVHRVHFPFASLLRRMSSESDRKTNPSPPEKEPGGHPNVLALEIVPHISSLVNSSDVNREKMIDGSTTLQHVTTKSQQKEGPRCKFTDPRETSTALTQPTRIGRPANQSATPKQPVWRYPLNPPQKRI